MKSIARGMVVQALENTGSLDESNLRLMYSGRGTMGEGCFGIITSELAQLAGFFVSLTELEIEDDDDTDRAGGESYEARVAHGLADRVLQDSIGRETIYYFPGYQIRDEA